MWLHAFLELWCLDGDDFKAVVNYFCCSGFFCSPNFQVAFITFASTAVMHLNLTRTADRYIPNTIVSSIFSVLQTKQTQKIFPRQNPLQYMTQSSYCICEPLNKYCSVCIVWIPSINMIKINLINHCETWFPRQGRWARGKHGIKVQR